MSLSFSYQHMRRSSNFLEQLIRVGDEGQGDRNGRLYRRIVEALGDARAGSLVGDFLADLRQVILCVGILYMSQECRTFAPQVSTTPQEVTVARLSAGET
jgi:hypothetical protein